MVSKAKKGIEQYTISQQKEKLEMAIESLRIDEEGKGETLTKEKLPKINNNEIDVRSTEKFPVEVICGKYKFYVDDNFNVTYVEEADGTIVTYTTQPEGYTNQDKIKILIKAVNHKGINKIIYPDGYELLSQGNTEVGIDYEVTKNGTYKFKILDNTGKEELKDIVIEQIDKKAPKKFIPQISDVRETSFTIISNAEDDDADSDNVKSGIEKYEYYIDDTKIETTEDKYIVTNSSVEKIYVIVYDKAGNMTKSNVIQINPIKDTTKLNNKMESNDSINGKVFANNNEQTAYQAFDENLDTYWDGRNIDSYIGYEFNEAVECTDVSINQPYTGDVIKNFKIQYSDDGINYYDASEILEYNRNENGKQEFTLNKNLGKHKYWRYKNLNNYTGNLYCAITELEFLYKKINSIEVSIELNPEMKNNISVDGKVFANNNEQTAYQAFDKNSDTYWDGKNIDSYIGYEFNEAVECTYVSINQPYAADTIKNFKIQYSDDGINYYDASEILEYNRNRNGKQEFTLNKNLGKHKYWRYKNLSNYTSNSYCAITELEFYQTI